MTDEQREYVLANLCSYWPENSEPVRAVCRQTQTQNLRLEEKMPAKGAVVVLPDWAEGIGVDGGLQVPEKYAETDWRKVDWLSVCFWYLNCQAERAWENLHGPVHSYSFRLSGWDGRFWEHAWVNRIALFLRKWAARESRSDETQLMGQLPKAQIHLTHDVDAVRKTIPIRIKQAGFHGVNAIRFLLDGQFRKSLNKMHRAVKFLLSTEDYWCFDTIMELEKLNGFKSTFNFYAGNVSRFRGSKNWLMDPSYDPGHGRLKQTIRSMHAEGWTIGLHQSYEAWRDDVQMKAERRHLETALGAPVTTCRQHRLRFSFADTWRSQEVAGFKQDMTLGFNDRSGFRNGSALAFCPWDEEKRCSMDIVALPMVIMDSHLYDYKQLRDEEVTVEMTKWVREINEVYGQATVIWHQRVMSMDYGWGRGFKNLLDLVNSKR
ncbi:MAG: polysaccharide deacetylase family protein [Opitutales bacterium]